MDKTSESKDDWTSGCAYEIAAFICLNIQTLDSVATFAVQTSMHCLFRARGYVLRLGGDHKPIRNVIPYENV